MDYAPYLIFSFHRSNIWFILHFIILLAVPYVLQWHWKKKKQIRTNTRNAEAFVGKSTKTHESFIAIWWIIMESIYETNTQKNVCFCTQITPSFITFKNHLINSDSYSFSEKLFTFNIFYDITWRDEPVVRLMLSNTSNPNRCSATRSFKSRR